MTERGDPYKIIPKKTQTAPTKFVLLLIVWKTSIVMVAMPAMNTASPIKIPATMN